MSFRRTARTVGGCGCGVNDTLCAICDLLPWRLMPASGASRACGSGRVGKIAIRSAAAAIHMNFRPRACEGQRNQKVAPAVIFFLRTPGRVPTQCVCVCMYVCVCVRRHPRAIAQANAGRGCGKAPFCPAVSYSVRRTLLFPPFLRCLLFSSRQCRRWVGSCGSADALSPVRPCECTAGGGALVCSVS